jgi:hypothetical protein
MANLILEVISGPNKGQKFPIELGYKLGSGFGDVKTEINIPARNIATLHAKILEDEKNQLILVAQSQSRMFFINSQKVSRVLLVPGQIFKIEEMLIKVVSKNDGEPNKVDKIQKSHKPLIIANLEPITEPNLPTEPNEFLENLLKTAPAHIPRNKLEIKIHFFKNPLQLKFIQGIQFDESFTIGWGPRSFGKNTFEHSLSDPIAPDLAFTLTPGNQGEYVFSTHYPNIIFINGHKLRKTIVSSGDKINFGETILELLELEYL